MSQRNFREMLEAKWAEGKFVCVGLDSDILKIPRAYVPHSKYMSAGEVQLAFNTCIVEETKDIACCYKPNIAFYEALGKDGLHSLREIIFHINEVAPSVPVILDAKRADIGNTNEGYVQMAFDYLKADAITVHPYLGQEALEPFLKLKDKGIFVLCRTSNPGAGEFQDIQLPSGVATPLYQYIALRVAMFWNKNGNCALVVGATYPEELAKVRRIIGDMPILIPGIGAQGGDLEQTVKAGKDSRGRGMIINSSRGIIFASSGTDFVKAARRETEKLHNSITQCLKGGVQ